MAAAKLFLLTSSHHGNGQSDCNSLVEKEKSIIGQNWTFSMPLGRSLDLPYLACSRRGMRRLDECQRSLSANVLYSYKWTCSRLESRGTAPQLETNVSLQNPSKATAGMQFINDEKFVSRKTEKRSSVVQIGSVVSSRIWLYDNEYLWTIQSDRMICPPGLTAFSSKSVVSDVRFV